MNRVTLEAQAVTPSTHQVADSDDGGDASIVSLSALASDSSAESAVTNARKQQQTGPWKSLHQCCCRALSLYAAGLSDQS